MPPKAVLFDFDGVIVDTENVHIAAWQRTLTRMAWELTDEAASRAAEIDDRVFLKELFEARGIEAGDIDGWIKLKQDLTERLLIDAPRIHPGVLELIRMLKARARLGIVTTTWRRNVEVVLTSAGILDAFEVIVAKEDVAAVKPAPDGYLRALAMLRIPASEVVAIEDSPTGLEAARAAGVRVVAVGHSRPSGEWSRDVPFVADLSAPLPALGFSDATDPLPATIKPS